MRKKKKLSDTQSVHERHAPNLCITNYVCEIKATWNIFSAVLFSSLDLRTPLDHSAHYIVVQER